MSYLEQVIDAVNNLPTLKDFRAEWHDAWRIEAITAELQGVQRQISVIELTLHAARELEAKYRVHETHYSKVARGEWRSLQCLSPSEKGEVIQLATLIEVNYGVRTGRLRDEIAAMEKELARLKHKERKLLKERNLVKDLD